MPINDGFLREEEMICSLNNHYVSDLSNNMKNLLKHLFGALDESQLVKCSKVDNSNKTDFVIEYDNRKRNVSMKSGRAETVHIEIVQNFIAYLKEKGISQRTLDTICLFQFGDGTTDGSNESERMAADDIRYLLRDRIEEANKELNKDINFIKDVVQRCVFKGANEDNIEADCVYFGDSEYGIVATKHQFERNIDRRRFDFYKYLHIGPLLLRPDARYVNKEIASERKRNRIVVYWPNLRADIEYMAKRYNY